MRMVPFANSLLATPTQGSMPGHWAEVVSHIDPRYGGLSSVVPALSTSVSELAGTPTTLLAFCAPGEYIIPAGLTADQVRMLPSSRFAWTSARLRREFAELLRHANGVHIHGLWESSTAVAASTCRALGIPYVLSAHGMLEPWALHSRRLKKLVYSQMVERRNVCGAACLHALTENEAGQYRSFGARAPIAVIPNGVVIPTQRDAGLFFERFPALLGKRIILFLGRLHPKKGLDLLLESWNSIASYWPNAHLVLAGPDFENTRARLEMIIQAKQLQQTVTFTEMLREEMKWSALAAAECFILPSHSEGLSISVLEALGLGLPVIITEACHMPEVVEKRAGWQVPATSDAITDALNQLLQNTPAQNRNLGRRGAELIQKRYIWPIIARQMAEVYAWVGGAAEPPSVPLLHV